MLEFLVSIQFPRIMLRIRGIVPEDRSFWLALRHKRCECDGDCGDGNASDRPPERRERNDAIDSPEHHGRDSEDAGHDGGNERNAADQNRERLGAVFTFDPAAAGYDVRFWFHHLAMPTSDITGRLYAVPCISLFNSLLI